MNTIEPNLIGLLGTDLKSSYNIIGVIVENNEKVIRLHLPDSEEKTMEIQKDNLAAIVIEPVPSEDLVAREDVEGIVKEVMEDEARTEEIREAAEAAGADPDVAEGMAKAA